MSREENIALVEEFFDCIRKKDLDRLPIHDDITFESPLIQQRRGKDAAIRYLTVVADSLTDIRVEQHIVDGENVATFIVEDTANGPLPVCSRFKIEDGLITENRVYYDARIVTG